MHGPVRALRERERESFDRRDREREREKEANPYCRCVLSNITVTYP